MHELKTIILAFTLLTGLFSCTKTIGHNRPDASSPPAAGNGVYVLLDGPTDSMVNGVEYNFGPGTYPSTLALYNPATGTVIPDRFSQVNGNSLGFQATDMGIYGSKLYIALSGSWTVVVVDVQTTRLLSRFTFNAMHPQNICFLNGLAYITTDEGSIAVMDTATFKVTKYLSFPKVGFYYPAGLVAANGKLYLGGLNSVASLDPQTGALIHCIPVYGGVETLTADASGKIYVQSLVDTISLSDASEAGWNGITPGISVISSTTDQVLDSMPSNSLNNKVPIVVSRDTAYYVTGDRVDDLIGGNITRFNTGTFTPLPNFNPGIQFTNVTTLCADPVTGQLFIGDSKQTGSLEGTVYAFLNSQLQYSFVAGANLVKIIPLH
jgi:hypothetical protein